MSTCIWLHMAATTTAADMSATRRATLLFTLVALSLGLLLLVAVLLVLARRSRRRMDQKPRSTQTVIADPWSEAARRVQPFDRADDGE